MEHLKVAKEVYKSPVWLVITLVLIIFAIYFGLELAQAFFSPLHSLVSAFFDGLFLLILITPVLYLLLFRPMAKYISELKIAKEALRKQKEFSENVIQIANVIVVGLNSDGKINLFSKAAERVTGYTFEELKDQDWFETVVPKEKYPQIWEEFERLKESGETAYSCENPILTKSGAERYISWQNGCVVEAGQVNGTISFGIDITEKKKADIEVKIHAKIEQAFLHSKDLTEILKLTHHSISKLMYAENCFFAFYDQNTGLFNFPYFVDQFDSKPEPNALTKSCTAFVFRTGKAAMITPEIFQQLKEQKEIELIGTASPSWIGVPLETSFRILGVMVLQHYKEEGVYDTHQLEFLKSIANHIADQIEHKRAKDELQKSNSLLTATLESTADGILVIDKEGNVAGYNHKFIELWQIPESIISTRKDEVLLSFVLDQLIDPAGFLNKVNELYRNDEEISRDYVEFKDGRTFSRYSQAQKIKGKIVGRVWCFRDITERIKSMHALSESETRLRELNATKDKFFSIIAHDLKSPFNSILGFSDILADQIRQKDYNGAEEFAEIIQNASQKAVDLIMNLMEWARSQSGRMDFNPEKIEIVALINEVFDLSNVSAINKSIIITKELPSQTLVYLDKDMISSVLRNLTSNAIKFTNPGGKIVIKAELVGEELIVSVSDNGIGIEQENLDKLFRIEESYSVPGTQNELGTGLGLILCKEFIDLHKGKIWAESEPGKGSSFYFTIPGNVN